MDDNSIAVEVQVETADDVAKGEQVADEEQWAEDRALGEILCDRGECGGVTREGDELSISEV